MIKVAIVVAALFASNAADAQILNNLKNVASGILSQKTGEGTANTITNLVGNLIGKKDVTEKNIVGTWKYEGPCVVFESENALSQLGNTAMTSKIENTMSKQLTKIGFTKGKVVMTFNQDGTGVISMGSKKSNVNWSVNGNTLSLTYPVTKKTMNINVKMNAGDLQMAMKMDKLVTLMNGVAGKSTSGILGTIGTMTQNIKGMYMGLKFRK